MGMLVLDYIVTKNQGFWIKNNELQGFVFETPMVKYFKPTLYMNVCGKAVKKALDYYKLDSSQLLVVHDDLDRKLGKISWKSSGSASGHNGLKSIINTLKTQEFERIRIGIGRPVEVDQVPDFVLTKFTNQEMDTITSQVYPKFDKLLDEFISRLK